MSLFAGESLFASVGLFAGIMYIGVVMYGKIICVFEITFKDVWTSINIRHIILSHRDQLEVKNLLFHSILERL